MTEPGLEALESVTLVLTASCNLSCRYCYQNGKSARRMDPDTLVAGLDLLMRSRSRAVRVAFVGGEPLLEAGLIRRAVEHVGRTAPERRISFAVITNGTLIRGREREFLIEHDVELRLSLDGVPAAQDLRGAGTFEALDRTLAALRRDHPDYFRRRVSVGITLVPDTVAHLAASVDYFLERRVPTVGISPVATHEPSWRPERIRELDAQFSRIHEASLEHRRRTGETPLELFRRKAGAGEETGGAIPMCGTARGRSAVVDVDGTVLGCTLFSELSQRPPPDLLARRLVLLEMGRVTAPALERSFREYRRRIATMDLFADRRTKHSSYGRCRECPHVVRCGVCPVSIGHVPGNDDPDRVPDFACAFYRAALAWRDRFPALPGPTEIAAGGSAGPHVLCDRAAARRGATASASTRSG